MVTVEQLWSEKYAALAAAELAREEERRAEDFIDATRTVCGIELRALTPRDLLLLSTAGNPFVAGGEIGPAAIAQFLWQLHAAPPRSWWGERKFFKHCAALDYDSAVAQIRAYLDRAFADAPAGRSGGGGESGRPVGTNFVAPLIVRLAAGIPSLSPQAIMDTPLAQLFQFRKVLAADAAAKSGGNFRDRSPTDRLLCECLDEANRLNAESAKTAEPDHETSALSAPSAFQTA